MTNEGSSLLTSLITTSLQIKKYELRHTLQQYGSLEVVIRAEYLPKGSSEYNAVEECWRQGKDDLLVSRYYPKFFNLKRAIEKRN